MAKHLVLLLSLFFMPLAPAKAQIFLPETVAFQSFNPAEFGNRMINTVQRMKDGLHPVLVVILYIGIALGLLLAFTFCVIFLFMIIMIFRRH